MCWHDMRYAHVLACHALCVFAVPRAICACAVLACSCACAGPACGLRMCWHGTFFHMCWPGAHFAHLLSWPAFSTCAGLCPGAGAGAGTCVRVAYVHALRAQGYTRFVWCVFVTPFKGVTNRAHISGPYTASDFPAYHTLPKTRTQCTVLCYSMLFKETHHVSGAAVKMAANCRISFTCF
jgi:hypothetical protein